MPERLSATSRRTMLRAVAAAVSAWPHPLLARHQAPDAGRDRWQRVPDLLAAMRMRDFAFDTFPVDELLAVRHPDNAASAQVMQRLGMHYRGLETWYGTTVATHALRRQP